MTDIELLDKLIFMLCSERGEPVPQIDDAQKPDYFRALCNVREPSPVTEEFINLQDEYLSRLAKSRGIVECDLLDYKNGIALWQGDITHLDADAIVNACNSRLLGCFAPLHACIDNCIHSFAGVQVRLDCNDLMRGGTEPNGKVKVTKAYNLPSKYIFHTVGPIVRGSVTEENKRDLTSCYLSCLNKAEDMRLGTIAFCCLSTGVFGYPQDAACSLAVNTVEKWLETHSDLKVIFNVFLDKDNELYKRKLNLI